MMFDHLVVIFVSILTCAFVGVLFTALKLPLPAPPTFAGVCGIFGVFFGYQFFLYISQRFF